jgi:uncharacterized protein YbjQ (UPF0145 family)
MKKIMMSGLSGNEIYCMDLKGFYSAGILVGNSVQSMGFIRGFTSAFKGVVGGEIENVTQMIHEGREQAFERMIQEANQHQANGIAGVNSEVRNLVGNSEFLFTGTALKSKNNENQKMFSSSGDAQELYCHMDAGYQPISFAFGNIAYSVGLAGGILGTLKTFAKGEIKEFSDVFNHTRHFALNRLLKNGYKNNANAVVGIRTNLMNFGGFHEMYMTGTAAYHQSLNVPKGDLVSSDLTGEELWSLTKLGYAPIKLLISTSVYSLGFIGGLKSVIKGFVKGEISDLTEMIYGAREEVFSRIEKEAMMLQADEVVGIKTYIVEIGSGLVEIFAIGTAVKKVDNLKVENENLPVQAIIRDKDTWLNGEGGFNLNTIRSGGSTMDN